MPQIVQTQHIDISPERFLKASSPLELMEVNLLIKSPRYQSIIVGFDSGNPQEFDLMELREPKP